MSILPPAAPPPALQAGGEIHHLSEVSFAHCCLHPRGEVASACSLTRRPWSWRWRLTHQKGAGSSVGGDGRGRDACKTSRDSHTGNSEAVETREPDGESRRLTAKADAKAVQQGRKKLGHFFSSRLQDRLFALPPATEPRKENAFAFLAFSVARGAATGTMATFARPVASSLAGINFDVYSDEDIKAISVKRIHNTPTLDSFNNPVPGGLYDPALGSWGDHVYVFSFPSFIL